MNDDTMEALVEGFQAITETVAKEFDACIDRVTSGSDRLLLTNIKARVLHRMEEVLNG